MFLPPVVILSEEQAHKYIEKRYGKINSSNLNRAHKVLSDAIKYNVAQLARTVLKTCPQILSNGCINDMSYLEAAVFAGSLSVSEVMIPYYEKLSKPGNQANRACLNALTYLDKTPPSVCFAEAVNKQIGRLTQLDYGFYSSKIVDKYQVVAPCYKTWKKVERSR